MTNSSFVWAYALQLSGRDTFSRTPEHVSDALLARPRVTGRGGGFWALTGQSVLFSDEEEHT